MTSRRGRRKTTRRRPVPASGNAARCGFFIEACGAPPSRATPTGRFVVPGGGATEDNRDESPASADLSGDSRPRWTAHDALTLRSNLRPALSRPRAAGGAVARRDAVVRERQGGEAGCGAG